MNCKPLILLLLLSTLPALAACNTATQSKPMVNVAKQSDTATAVAASVADCPPVTPGTQQLIDAAQGICFLYPDDYDVSQGTEETFGLYVHSPLNTEAPLASISFEAANGRSLDDVTNQRLADYAFPDTQPQSMLLGGEPAVMLDNLPGQDANRRLFTIHNDTVIDLLVARIGEGYGEVGRAGGGAVRDDYRFVSVHPRSGRCVPRQAGPECPAPVANSTIYTNDVGGYCLLLPAGYNILEISAEGADSEMAFYIDRIQDVNHPRLSIKVSDANDRSLDEITIAL